jgi:glyoxylase-like metal-dependent hydrolase (beta-lactamase superfamily II)
VIELENHIGHLTTSGVFSLDGQDFDVENNVWIVGDESEVIVIDAPHSAGVIAEAVRSGEGAGDDHPAPRVVAIVATHGHNDHVNAAPELSGLLAAPVLLHDADLPLWREVHGRDRLPDGSLAAGDVLRAGPVELQVIHTPGHTPGGCCLYWEAGEVLFSGDTLFKGGPGATGRSWSDFPTIIGSIRSRLLPLPPATRVLTGHGDETRIGDEAPHLEEWIARGR